MKLDTPEDVARRCVNSIVIDIADRPFIGRAWGAMSEEERREAEKEWRDIIAVELGGHPE